MKRQGNKPEKSYIKLTPGTPVWVQHRQNTTWEPATVVSQCTTNSYWIMQENSTEQPKVYRRTRSILKIRSTPTEAKQTGYMNSQSTEPEKAEFHTPAISNMVRDCVQENSLENISPDPVQMTLPTSDTYPQTSASFDSKSEDREEIADAPALEIPKEQGTYTLGSQNQQERTLGSQPVHLVIFTCKDTTASRSVEYQFKMLNFELYVLYSEPYSIVTVIGIDYCKHSMSFRTIAPLNT